MYITILIFIHVLGDSCRDSEFNGIQSIQKCKKLLSHTQKKIKTLADRFKYKYIALKSIRNILKMELNYMEGDEANMLRKCQGHF